MVSFRTVSGRHVDLENPKVDDVVIDDIVTGLSHQSRYYGQLTTFYSIAQHSMLVASVVDRPLFRAALFHDATEAYLGDVSRNLKHSPWMAGYRTLEQRWQLVIEEALNIQLSDADRQHIKAADNLVAIFERTVLRHRRSWYSVICIDDAIADGWVKGHREEMIRLASRLQTHGPLVCGEALSSWVLSPNEAYATFYMYGQLR